MKKIIILAIIYCLLLTVYSPLSYSAVLLDRVVATVNDEVITWSELRRNIELEGKEFLKGLTDEERAKKIQEIEKPFLNSMIDVKLQLQEARKFGLNISLSETEGAIADIKRKYNLTDESLIESLKAEGFTLDEYRTRLAEQILLSKVVRHRVRDNILIMDKEIEEYYEANKEKYRKREKVRIRQIFFTKPEDDTQKANIEVKAQEIIQRIKKGEDFAKIANEFSEDASKEFGGDLGYVSRGSVLKEIEDVAFALNIGEVSRPFWSSTGLHIVKLEDRIEGSNIEEVRNKIKEVLFEKAFKLKYEDWIKGLREKAYIEINL
jgi:peptidyl-prolyl cis-trans isomerase SurA